MNYVAGYSFVFIVVNLSVCAKNVNEKAFQVVLKRHLNSQFTAFIGVGQVLRILDRARTTQCPVEVALVLAGRAFGRDQARSKRSAFITFVHAATKSCTNFSLLSSCA